MTSTIQSATFAWFRYLPLVAVLGVGCGGGSGGDTDANDAPVISGTSIDFVRSGKNYSFTPTAVDPENDHLRYSIENQPYWASFDATTGMLSGIPDDLAVDIYHEIRISVSDGDHVVSLPPFSLKVMYAEIGRSNVQLDPLATVINTSDGYAVEGDAAIKVGSLTTELKNADLQFEYDADGDLLDVFGETDLPPVISDTLSVATGARAVVGMFTGAEINARDDIGPDSAPGILLRDEFRYLVYFLDTNVDLVFHGLESDVAIPLAGSQTLIITDPTDPFFYYFGEIAGLSAGYGKSFNANVPYESLFDPTGSTAFDAIEPFYGTDVLKGTFPITAYKVFDVLEFSGTAICAPPQLLDCDKPSPSGLVVSLADALLIQGGIDPSQQFKVGINGIARVAFRVLNVDLFTYHLFDMASQIDVGTDREKLAIQGVIDPAQSDSPAWLPIKPVPDPGVVMVGNLFADVETNTGDGDFGISLYGEFPSSFPAATISGSIDINSLGLQFTGSVPDPQNPITVTALADDQEFSAGIEFGYDFSGNIDAVIDNGVDRALEKVDQVTHDLEDAIGAYELAFSLDGFRENIPALVDIAIDELEDVPGKVYTSVYNAVVNGIRSKSYSYKIPPVGPTVTLDAEDFVNEQSIGTSAANDARSTAQGIVDDRIAELNELKAQAQEVRDGPAFRAALKTALETVAAHDKVTISVSESVTVKFKYAGVTVKTSTYTFTGGGTYTVFDSTTKSNLQTAAANVDDIDPAQTLVVDTQQILDQLPTKDDLNQVADDVRDGLIEPPVVNGGGYTVTRGGDQSAYVLLGNDRIDITFNPLDPAAAVQGVGDAIVEYMAQ